MHTDKYLDLIHEVVELSKRNDTKLDDKVDELIHFCRGTAKENRKLHKQNSYFLKQWDKKNIILHEEELKKDKMLEQQSKMAAMGEMMDAVAHQWKQPLNSFSMLSELLEIDFNNGSVDKAYIKEFNETLHLQIDHMLSTLNEFRNFFRPNQNNENFHLNDCVKSVQLLMKDELLSQKINITLDIDEFITINGIKNEFIHIFLNLLSNSIDAFNERDIQNREVAIRCYEENSKTYIEFEDNAGGIPQNVIKDIFKPNVTTKADGKGTGIGLYMSSQIIQKNHGTINVHNTEDGSFFTIILYNQHIPSSL